MGGYHDPDEVDENGLPGFFYDHPVFEKFIRDMKKAGFEVRAYKGRFFYHGPAVIVSNKKKAMDATKLKVQCETLAKKFVVYPIKSQAFEDKKTGESWDEDDC